MKGKIIFEEEQSFVGTWMWYLILGVSLLSVGGSTAGYFMIEEKEGVIGLIIASMVTIGIVGVLYTSKLSIIVDRNTFYYRFPPFVSSERSIKREDVKELYIRTYRPISEYGGWGYRYRFRSGRALCIVGNIGVQIVTNNDKKILIGTQKPELLERAITQLKENWGMNNAK